MNSVFKEPFNDLLSKNRTFIMGCAMIAIMLFHQPFFYDYYVVTFFHLFGHWGVDVFLLVSGFGVINSLQKNTIKQYFKNRINRLVPPCIFVGACKCLLMLLGFINFAVYNDNYLLILTELSMWYIYAIVIYYAISPSLYKLLLKYRFWVIVCTIILTLTLSCIPFASSSLYLVNRTGWVIERLPAFVFGMYIALYPFSRFKAKSIIVLGFISLIICMFLRITGVPGHGRVIYMILLFALPMLCILAALLAKLSEKVRVKGLIEYFGTTSLELYLWHGFIFLNVSSHIIFANLNMWCKFIVAFLISIVFSHLTYCLKQHIPSIIK